MLDNIMRTRSFCYSDVIYYDILISGVNDELTTAKYFSNSLENIVEDPDDYVVGISQYVIPTTGIPLFIFKVQTGQPDINLGIYSFTMTNPAGTNIQQNYVTYATQNVNFNGYVEPPLTEQADSIYYYVYHIHHFLELINQTLQTMFTAYGLAFGLPGAMDKAPYFIWKPETRTFALILEQAWVDNGYRLWTNIATNAFFPGINIKFYGYNYGQQQEIEYVLDYTYQYPQEDNAYFPKGNNSANPMWLQYEQPYAMLDNWIITRSLILMSNLLPLNPTWYPPTQQTTEQYKSGTTNRKKVFEIVLDSDPNDKNLGNRAIRNKGVTDLGFIDMLGSFNKIRDIDMQVFWADLKGNFHPLYIFSYDQVFIQLCFIKKSLFKGWARGEQLCAGQ